LRKLEQIRAYRDAGLALSDVKALLDGEAGSGSSSTILKRRFLEIDREIGILRRQQQAILRLLPTPNDRRKVMTKDKWVAIMRGTGFSDEEMDRWHFEFESTAPEDHQQFLEYLQIGPEEITKIREWSRNRGHKS
jgi:DNA-binding transcriptional MerR regulator